MKKAFLALSLWFIASGVSAFALPQANLKISPSVGSVYSEITFDASDSRNVGGNQSGLKYRFRFQPSGDWTSFSSNSKATFIPKQVGNYRAHLQVKNRDGLTNTTYTSYKVRGQELRQARVEVLNPRALVGESVFFQLHINIPSGQDPDKVSARWDFDGDGRFDTSFLTRKIVSYEYDKALSVTPRVEVKWSDGKIETIEKPYDIQKISLRESALLPPVLSVSPSYDEIPEGTMVTFDASGTNFAQGGWIEWHIDGAEVIQYKKTIDISFDTPGNHAVVVRNCYQRSRPLCKEKRVHIKVKSKPIGGWVDVRVSNRDNNTLPKGQDYLFASVGDQLQFQVSVRTQGSYRRTGTLYRWDFEGDGVFDTGFLKNTTVSHTFHRAGNYKPLVEVTYDQLRHISEILSGTSQVYITGNIAPYGDFFVREEVVFVGEKATFVARVGDRESSGSRLKTRWDIGGDGVWDTEFRGGSTLQWQFNTPGKHPITMQVLDGGGKTHQVQKIIEVLDLPVPVARVQVDTRTGTSTVGFRFNASESIGHDLRYYWYFPSPDGGYEKRVTKTPKIAKRLSLLGKNRVYLQVIDPKGAADYVGFDVFVSEG